MNDNLKQVIEQRLEAQGMRQKPWAAVVLAAGDGRDALDALLDNKSSTSRKQQSLPAKPRPGAFLTSLTVEGFRGVGPKQTIAVTPGPGLTVIVGRNGSGKSSFAEALEVLLTGDSKRWSDRSKIWKEGWRNLHQADPASISADFIFEGGGELKVSGSWKPDEALEEQQVVAQIKGKPKTTLDNLGWAGALVSYRPFLSYNELGSMLDEGPSKLYDALSLVLGLEDLVNAQSVLAKCRLDRQQPLDLAQDARDQHIETLKSLLSEEHDDRASACLEALSEKKWGLTAIAKIVSGGAVPEASQDISVLTRAVALEIADPPHVKSVVELLKKADKQLKDAAGGDADEARQIASLLEQAVAFHTDHGDRECPVCGGKPGLTAAWAQSSRKEIERLRRTASKSDEAHRAAEAAKRSAAEMLGAPPKLLAQLFDIGVEGLADARERWNKWHAGAALTQLGEIIEHVEKHYEPFADAIEVLKKAAAAELRRREDRWRPVVTELAEWAELATTARAAAEPIPLIKDAEKWLKDAAAEIRDQRFAPIADKAMATWEHLRQQSNVTLGKIELTGTKSSRRVSLDVTVDGVQGAALGVMSQGELHSLALSLFLPRATLQESPFRFVVIDDPVQSMDPARVDGLARALEETAATRQVIVFTHDERLTDAVRRLGIKSRVLAVTRRPNSVVEVRTGLDPVRANLEDALALAHTAELPRPVLQRIIPGYCRAALESAFISAARHRLLASGRAHTEVDDLLAKGGKLTPLAALALFDDADRGSEVLARLNKYGAWAADTFRQVNEGAHKEYKGDLHQLIKDTEKLAERVGALA